MFLIKNSIVSAFFVLIQTSERKFLNSFLKMGQSRPLFLFIFVLYSLQFQIYIFKTQRWCACDSNPRPQDGRLRQYHGATYGGRPKFLNVAEI